MAPLTYTKILRPLQTDPVTKLPAQEQVEIGMLVIYYIFSHICGNFVT
jgi:hypothetical protein